MGSCAWYRSEPRLRSGRPLKPWRPAGNLSAGFRLRSYNPLSAGSDMVTPIRTATNTALKPITVGSGPVAVAITP